MRQERVGWRGAEIKEDRAVGFQDASELGGPFARPLEVIGPLLAIGVTAVGNAEIVGWRGDYQIDRGGGEVGHSDNAILAAEIERRHERSVERSVRESSGRAR